MDQKFFVVYEMAGDYELRGVFSNQKDADAAVEGNERLCVVEQTQREIKDTLLKSVQRLINAKLREVQSEGVVVNINQKRLW